MRSQPRIFFTLFLLAAAAEIAPAQGLRYGFQFGPSQPLGDLNRADLSLGFTGGLSVLLDLGKGHMLRPRVDHANWSGDEHSGFFGPPDIEVRAYGIGVDYRFHFSGQTKGLYLLAGLGYQRSTVINRRTFYGSVPPEGWIRAGSGNAATYALGLGRQHNDLFGTELRYSASKPAIGGSGVQFNTLSLSFSFHWGR